MSQNQKPTFTEPTLTEEASLIEITLLSGTAGAPIKPKRG